MTREPYRIVTVRLKLTILERVDAIAPEMAMPGRKANRSDALRGLIITGLDALEAERAGTPKPGKRGRKL